MFKTANVGNADRILRLVVGAILIALPFTVISTADGSVLRWLLPLVGAVLIGTALVRFCPMYRLIGTSTCKT